MAVVNETVLRHLVVFRRAMKKPIATLCTRMQACLRVLQWTF
jgi:hypothetical protein